MVSGSADKLVRVYDQKNNFKIKYELKEALGPVFYLYIRYSV